MNAEWGGIVLVEKVTPGRHGLVDSVHAGWMHRVEMHRVRVRGGVVKMDLDAVSLGGPHRGAGNAAVVRPGLVGDARHDLDVLYFRSYPVLSQPLSAGQNTHRAVVEISEDRHGVEPVGCSIDAPDHTGHERGMAPPVHCHLRLCYMSIAGAERAALAPVHARMTNGVRTIAANRQTRRGLTCHRLSGTRGHTRRSTLRSAHLPARGGEREGLRSLPPPPVRVPLLPAPGRSIPGVGAGRGRGR